MRAARGSASKDSIQASYTRSEYLILPKASSLKLANYLEKILTLLLEGEILS